MAKRLFGTRDRDEAHRRLAEVLASGTSPQASCREDPNDAAEPFQVWDGSPEPHTLPPESPPALPHGLSESDLDRIAERVARHLQKGGG